MSVTNRTIQLNVISGPDTGLQKTFKKDVIKIGRGANNDFVLNDGFVSNFHAELTHLPNKIIYRDLKSRHGSLVCVDSVSYHLHNKTEETSIVVNSDTELQIGCTLVKLVVLDDQPEEASQEDAMLEEMLRAPRTSRARETMITSAIQPSQNITRQFEASDRRLAVLFRLAERLNGLNQLEDILDEISEAVFDAFPAANFFSMTAVDTDISEQLGETFMVRLRHPNDSDEQPVLSQSILKQVVETRESVLFVKDSLGPDLTQSIIDAQITACLCAPLIGQRSLLGVMEVDTRGLGSLFSKKDLDLFSILASLAAFALERASLTQNIVEMFESFVHASVNAIEGRDPTTAGHSERVALYTVAIAEEVNGIEAGHFKDMSFDPNEMTELRYAALLHDFGKIAVRENVLMKAKRLPELHLELIAQRFDTIKAMAYQHIVQKPLQSAVTQKLTAHVLGDLENQYKAFCQDIDDQYNWLYEVASKGWLPDEDIERVQKIAKRQYQDFHGHTKPYLTPYEVENMCIRRGTLNAEEWENMRSHAAFSRDYLERIPWSAELKNIPCIAGDHHEKLDGSGYPRGLGAEDIRPQVRMLTIADIFDALTASDRAYRKAAPIERALKILNEEADQGKLDRRLVDLFCDRVVHKIQNHIPKH